MALSFKDIASKKLDDIERPPLPPVGTYRWRISKLPVIEEDVGNGKWDVLRVNCVAVEALGDVDMDGYNGAVEKIMNNVSFMFDKEDEVAFEQTEFRAKKFFSDHVQCTEPGMSVMEGINASVNGEFLGVIGWKADKNDPDLFHANIVRTAPVE